jgi:hypothetical protein
MSPTGHLCMRSIPTDHAVSPLQPQPAHLLRAMCCAIHMLAIVLKRVPFLGSNRLAARRSPASPLDTMSHSGTSATFFERRRMKNTNLEQRGVGRSTTAGGSSALSACTKVFASALRNVTRCAVLTMASVAPWHIWVKSHQQLLSLRNQCGQHAALCQLCCAVLCYAVLCCVMLCFGESPVHLPHAANLHWPLGLYSCCTNYAVLCCLIEMLCRGPCLYCATIGLPSTRPYAMLCYAESLITHHVLKAASSSCACGKFRQHAVLCQLHCPMLHLCYAEPPIHSPCVECHQQLRSLCSELRQHPVPTALSYPILCYAVLL